MKQDRSIRLYNVMFPIWFFFFLPPIWLVMLPVNFGVDTLVLMLSARKQQVEDRKALWKRHILPVWGIGFLSDLIGAGLVFLIYLVVAESPLVDTWMNPVLFPGTTIISIPGVVLAGVMIYILNKKLTFRKSALDPAVIHKLCLHLAIFTAPYTMLIPLYW